VSYQLIRLPAFSVNRTKRLIKSPKLYWSDTGLALHLAGESTPRGPHLENLILGDLMAWRGARTDRTSILHWRTTKGAEVDFIIEGAQEVLPIEVKAARRVRTADARHLEVFLQDYADLAPAGLLLYDGDDTFWLTRRVVAAPWWRVI
jgi:predicted AAA+ superfamily ATPase